jgi:hypothetical protein
MNKLQQQAAPDQIWIQVLDAEDAELSDPVLFTEKDDWYASLFNAYFLSCIRRENEGFADEDSPAFGDLKPMLGQFFSDSSLSEIHRYCCLRWLQAPENSQLQGTWMSTSWKEFQYENESGSAIGFFYTDEHEIYLQPESGEAAVRTGIPLKKPGYACIVFLNGEGVYRMFQLSARPGFWSQNLFPFRSSPDDAFHSKEFFRMCKSFSEDVLLKEQHKSREEQLGFLSDSVSFTKENQEVSFEAFREDVLKEPSLINAFDDYREAYSDRRQWNPPDKFAVSKEVQNQVGKYLKSVIKLDKNFHIYVHGAKDRIEKGFDNSRNLNYYTLWFDAEN